MNCSTIIEEYCLNSSVFTLQNMKLLESGSVADSGNNFVNFLILRSELSDIFIHDPSWAVMFGAKAALAVGTEWIERLSVVSRWYLRRSYILARSLLNYLDHYV